VSAQNQGGHARCLGGGKALHHRIMATKTMLLINKHTIPSVTWQYPTSSSFANVSNLFARLDTRQVTFMARHPEHHELVVRSTPYALPCCLNGLTPLTFIRSFQVAVKEVEWVGRMPTAAVATRR
jgi:hypothetical protein